MPGRPRKNKTITVDFQVYRDLEEEAIENDSTIKEVAEKHIGKENNEKDKQINRLRNQLEEYREDYRELKQKYADVKESKQEILARNKNFAQEVRERSMEPEPIKALLRSKDGIGAHTASLALDLFADEDVYLFKMK